MAMMEAARRVKDLYRSADFERPGVREAMLLDHLERLTLLQRRAWQARFCGIVRVPVGHHWVDIAGPRRSTAETADYLGCDESAVWVLVSRAAPHLIEAMGGEA